MLLSSRPSLLLDGACEFICEPEWGFEAGRLPAGESIRVVGAWEAPLAEPSGIVHGWFRRSFGVPDGSRLARHEMCIAELG